MAARFESCFALRCKPLEQRGRLVRILQVAQYIAVDIKREVKADHIRVFERRQLWQPQARSVFQGHIHCLRIRDPMFDKGNRLPPQGVLQAVCYEAGNVFFAHDRLFSRPLQLFCAQLCDVLAGLFRFDQLHKGHQVRRVPKMHADEPPFVLHSFRYFRRTHHRRIGCEDRFLPAQLFQPGEHLALEPHILKYTFYDQTRSFHRLLEVGAEANMFKDFLLIYLIGCAFADHDLYIGFYLPDRIYIDVGIV